jgi:hypothetical protein
MFVQIIEGRVADREALRRQADRWMEELRPGATGWLGSTMGISGDGRCVSIERFESEAAARANSDRAEQGAWWNETEKAFDGDVSFVDSSDVDVLLRGGGSDEAGFVQVMKVRTNDAAKVRSIDSQLEAHEAEFRHDVLGALRVWTGDDSYVQVVYFTSEADARAGESQEPQGELAELMRDWETTMADVEFIDLPEPWLYSA